MSKGWVGLVLYYLATRVFFLQVHPVYYDSFEYVRLIKEMGERGIAEAIKASHQPVHTLYLLLAGLVDRVVAYPELSLVLVSLISGLGAVVFWTLFVEKLTHSDKTALLSGLVLCMMPGFLVATTNILYESLLLFLQIGSLWAAEEYIDRDKLGWLGLSAAVLGLAQLVFIGNVFFLIPVVAVLAQKQERMKLWQWTLFGAILVAVGWGVDWHWLGALSVYAKYVSHAGDMVSGSGGAWLLLGRVLRNIAYITLALIGPVVAILGGVAILEKTKYWRARVVLAGLTLPALLLMQYWHAGAYGRLGILIVLPVSLIIAMAWGKRRIWLVMGLILMTWQILQLGYRQQTTPYILALKQWASEKVEGGESFGMAVSDNTRMALEGLPVAVQVIKGDMGALGEKRYIDQAALQYPYWQPDGWDYHLLSKKNGPRKVGEWVEQNCALKEVFRAKSRPELIIYEFSECRAINSSDIVKHR